MLIILLAAISAAAGAAGIVLLIDRLTGRRLPRWVMPTAVGVTVIGFAIWNEYSWFPRVTGELSGDTVIASAPGERAFYRPWTYIVPLRQRFVALDRSRIGNVAGADGVIVAPVLIVQRWAPTRQVLVAFDCDAGRRADVPVGTDLASAGSVDGLAWRVVGSDDSLVKAACDGG